MDGLRRLQAMAARLQRFQARRHAVAAGIDARQRGAKAAIDLDPVKFDSIVTIKMDGKFKDLPADTSAGIFTSGLLGESYIGLQPGGDPDVLKAGDEIAFTQPAVDLIQLVGKYMFSGGGAGGDAAPSNESHDGAPAPATETQP